MEHFSSFLHWGKGACYPHPHPPQGLYQLVPRLGKGSLGAVSSCRRDFLGRGHRDPDPALLQLLSRLFSLPLRELTPCKAGAPHPGCPSISGLQCPRGGRSGGGDAQPVLSVLHGAKTHKCPSGAKQSSASLRQAQLE